jgi:hypothetical protein
MGTESIIEAQYVLLVLRQAKLSTQDGASGLLDDLRQRLDFGRAQCAAQARSEVGQAVKNLKESLDKNLWPREEMWREALNLAAQWRAALK